MLEVPVAPSARIRKLSAEPVSIEGPSLVLVIEGECRARDCGEDCVRMETGDLLTVAPGGRCELEPGHRDVEILWFSAGREWTRDALALAGGTLPSAGNPLHVDRAESDLARRAARTLRELALPRRSEDPLAELHAAARHLELLAITVTPRECILLPGARRAGVQARARRNLFRETIEGLAEQSLDGVSLDTVARALGASPRQVSRLFRSELGTTFREHLASLRMERAKRLLRETDLPVIEVAAETGWSSLGHFNSTFRQRVGQTPSSYRAAREADQAA
jgi:AraC-like DNA-binding protein